MPTYEERLQAQAELSLGITERVLNGEEVQETQRKTALSMLTTREKNAAGRNRAIVNVISLVKHVRSAAVREEAALTMLRQILPAGALASAEVTPVDLPALAAEPAQSDADTG